MITLIGTGHVFDIGARVRDEIRRRAPQVVGIELDAPRYHALRNKNKDRTGTPIVYRMLADFQTRIANEYGVEAGDEMLAASDEARALGIPLALIDKDAQQTFQRLKSEMRFGEKARLVTSAIVGLVPLFPGKSIEKQVEEMQDDYTSYFVEMGKRFPTLKRVLLDERNEHMANALAKLRETNERVVAVLGDGHVDGIHDLLVARGLAVETVRLKELRAKSPPPVGNASATLTMQIDGASPPPQD
ncbi:MAG TPA: TraB/GumN family protein [Candidatus Thermoplasmatota archaeon]|nr:TraB/GumN family protein [Candidatus Thermoplasmatota archaeon]